jgi:hypothetical protein
MNIIVSWDVVQCVLFICGLLSDTITNSEDTAWNVGIIDL